jgi:hypothetical protein
MRRKEHSLEVALFTVHQLLEIYIPAWGTNAYKTSFSLRMQLTVVFG